MNAGNIQSLKITAIPHDNILNSSVFDRAFIRFKRKCFKWLFNIDSQPRKIS